MDTSLLDYDLPKELIAQFPTRERDQSRLLVYDRATGTVDHLEFVNIGHYLQRGDALVINNTKVFKARLMGRRKTGGQVEILLVRVVPSEAGERWEALVRPARRVKAGERILFDASHYVVMERDIGGGRWHVWFDTRDIRERIVDSFGHVPLPPYISRQDQPADMERYQTIFADPERVGAIAAPTAGFHFTRSILQALGEKGVEIVEITLHVGPGTFKPIQCDNLENHTVDPEEAELPAAAAERLNQTREAGGAIFAAGTTSVRTLESAPVVDGRIKPFAEMVDLYIRPEYHFKVVDHLLTNFHLPRSSLLALVAAFAGREEILSLYHTAIEMKYSFYSYGDAMLIL